VLNLEKKTSSVTDNLCVEMNQTETDMVKNFLVGQNKPDCFTVSK